VGTRRSLDPHRRYVQLCRGAAGVLSRVCLMRGGVEVRDAYCQHNRARGGTLGRMRRPPANEREPFGVRQNAMTRSESSAAGANGVNLLP